MDLELKCSSVEVGEERAVKYFGIELKDNEDE